MTRTAVVALCAAVGLAAATAASAREAVSIDQLTDPDWQGALAPNAAFTPPPDAEPAHAPFTGTLELSETTMSTDPAELEARQVFGQDTKVFPGVSIDFFTHDGDLVPVTRDVIRHGSLGRGDSYWDVIVQPGRVWSEAGENGWSRAAFPFALVHEIEGETHNGVASFAYRDGEVSEVRFQIVQQTAPYYVTDYFTAWGQTAADYETGAPFDLPALREAYAEERADRLPVASWSALAEEVGADRVSGFEADMDQGEVLVSGLVRDGIIYRKPCKAAGDGDLPYCDRARFGVWSVTKSAASAVALLRLAEKYGAEVFEARIVDYLNDTAAHDGWAQVTFGDALNMATGIGHGSTETDPNDINDGYLGGDYAAWYEAPSEAAKVAKVFESANYPWGPGEAVRYRDRDMFLLGVAMDAYLKTQEGPTADIWDMVAQEVFAEIGIHHAPMNRTLEPDGSRGQPMMAYGWYPNLQDLAKLARLIHDGGRHDGRQLLHAGKLAEILYGPEDRGLATGDPTHPRYHMAFWHARYGGPDGCELWLPEMRGWGGNLVSLMPGGLTGFRLAKNWDGEGAVTDTSGMHEVGDRLAGFCD